MKQFWEIKAQAGDALLFFRMGDFYELFGDDAVEAARLLEITLTTRDKGKPNAQPMAGVPHHSVQGYLQRLLKLGRKVAFADQMEDPATVKGKAIVRRELTRIFTPAVQFDSEGSEQSWLACAVPADETGALQDSWCLACLDPATGETLISDVMNEESLAAELGALPIRHFLRLGHRLPESAAQAVRKPDTLFEDLAENFLSPAQAEETLRKQLGLHHLDSFFPEPAAARALAICLHYTARSQRLERLAHLQLPRPLRRAETLVLGPRTAAHLDLLPTADGTPNVFAQINRTRTAAGSRLLRRWLLEPLRKPEEIAERQDALKELATRDSVLRVCREKLAEGYDLDRILGRVSTRLVNPRDTLALGRTLALLPSLAEQLAPSESEALRNLYAELSDAESRLGKLARRILTTQREEAPLVSRDAGIFARGTSPELDHLIDLCENGERWLVELEARERAATGIPSLKVRYNRVFGYYIEVTSAHLKNVPTHYQRKQTTVGAERFFTEELKKFEDEIVTAEHRRKSLEQSLFDALVASIQEQAPAISGAASALARLDVLLSGAELARDSSWVFPEIDHGLSLEIRSGRHPLVDAHARGSFVPNDLKLSPETRRLLLITGPNMGGKSTVMRQTAVIVVLGQLGLPVPARSARWGAVHSLYTRIGAHDAIARGQSTFMVEMSELAHILHHAEERSLIILDEIGRGTSTYDGVSVAWATLEHLARKTGARTLFATHYHELTRLAAELPACANAHLAVETSENGELRFLYKLEEGATEESFGVHVARIAGLPRTVVERAWQVLKELEAQPGRHAPGAGVEGQLSLFQEETPSGREAAENSRAQRAFQEAYQEAPQVAPAPPEALAASATLQQLDEADPNQMTPIQALNFLVELKQLSRASQ